MSGVALPVLATMRPIRRMVWLAAVVPVPGKPFIEYLATEEAAGAVTMPMDNHEPDELGRGALPWALARDYFYHDCPPDLAKWAWEHLRAQSVGAFVEPCPIAIWPDVPSTYIIMEDDRCIGQDWSRRAAQRINADVIELSGGHSPFLAQPKRLADILTNLASA